MRGSRIPHPSQRGISPYCRQAPATHAYHQPLGARRVDSSNLLSERGHRPFHEPHVGRVSASQSEKLSASYKSARFCHGLCAKTAFYRDTCRAAQGPLIASISSRPAAPSLRVLLHGTVTCILPKSKYDHVLFLIYNMTYPGSLRIWVLPTSTCPHMLT